MALIRKGTGKAPTAEGTKEHGGEIGGIANHRGTKTSPRRRGDTENSQDRKPERPQHEDQNLERNFLYVVGTSSGSTRVSPTALIKFTSPNQRGRMCMWM